MTRMFLGNATGMAGIVAAGLMLNTLGCTTTTTEAPPESTVDLSDALPPEPAPVPPPAPTPDLAPTPAPAVTATPAASQRMHTVARGDTIFNLAERYYGRGSKANQDKILAANPGLEPTRMTIGKQLVIP